jgi:hypothetical protein
MGREEEISSIARRIWREEGCIDGHADKHWNMAIAIWEKRQIRRQVLYLVIIALFLGFMPFCEWRLGTFQVSYGVIAGIAFILTIVFWYWEKKRKRNNKIWRQILSLVMIALYFILLLDYERKSGTFQESHEIFLIIVFILTTVFSLFQDWWWWFRDLVGMEGEFTSSVLARLQICMLGAALISLYLLLSGQNNVVPPVLQFSIIPITATLGGLVVAGANYSKINLERRIELLKVAQKLIVATIAFIFFASIYFLAGDVKPNVTPLTQFEWIKYILFWLATFLFYSGTTLFVIGIIDLAIGLKALKKG